MDARISHRNLLPLPRPADILQALDVGAGVGLVVTDPTLPDNPIIHINTEFLAITGYEKDEVIGRNPRFLQGPESERAAVMRLHEAVAAGKPISIQLINYRKSGEAFSMNIDIRPIHDEDGGVRYFVGTLTDESARLAMLAALRHHEQELADTLQQLERISRARMHFFAAASHDLRQPMQALALFTSALEKYAIQPEMRTILCSMKASLKSMEEMFNTLLDISRLDAGILEPNCTDFFLNDLFQQLEDEFQPQAAHAGLRLDVIPSSRVIHSDPQLLLRILRNFLSNALRYTSKGRILLGARRQGKTLSIQVWDTGPGIPEDRRLAIFQEFYQGEFSAADKKGGGLGLGLAIVKRLALVLGHALDVKSHLCKGTMFAIKVPLAGTEIGTHADRDP